MPKVAAIIILVLAGSLVDAKVYRNVNPCTSTHFENPLIVENDLRVATPPTRPSRAVTYSSRSEFTAVLVDSSKNGYGLYSNTTNPLEWAQGSGLLAVYRQWNGLAASAGYIGAAQSADGETWETVSGINLYYPGGQNPDTPDGEPGGRYPSAVGLAGGYPTPVWNEYTSGSGGGTNGGRAMYTWDEFGWLGGSYASPVYDLNTGCATPPCNPPDLWVGQAQMLAGTTGPVLLAVFGESLGPDRYWLLRNDYELFGYLGMAAPVLFMDRVNDGFYYESGSSYTGTPEFHVNSSGVGYAVTSTYWSNYNSGGPIQNHTLMFKKTTDFGATWTTSGGVDNSGWWALPDTTLARLTADAGLAGDTIIFTGPDTVIISHLFVGYEHDVKVDEAGGLHVNVNCGVGGYSADGSYAFTNTIPGSGFYHFYNPTPEDPSGWHISLIQDMNYSYLFDIGPNDGQAGTAAWYKFWPDMVLSTDPGSQVIWTIYPLVTAIDSSDTNVWYVDDLDLVLARSEDNGLSWTNIGNLTNTPGENAHEQDVHMAGTATDSVCYFIFQAADLSTLTVPDNALYADYKQWVYVGRYGPPPEVGVAPESILPAAFTLDQNYPNPFNPETNLSYSLASRGFVELVLVDVRGNHVRTLVNREQSPGNYYLSFDSAGLTSGVYFYRLTVDGASLTRKMVVMK